MGSNGVFLTTYVSFGYASLASFQLTTCCCPIPSWLHECLCLKIDRDQTEKKTKVWIHKLDMISKDPCGHEQLKILMMNMGGLLAW